MNTITITANPAPLTLAEVDAIKANGGQITYNLDGDRVISYPRWAVDQHTLALHAEMHG